MRTKNARPYGCVAAQDSRRYRLSWRLRRPAVPMRCVWTRVETAAIARCLYDFRNADSPDLHAVQTNSVLTWATQHQHCPRLHWQENRRRMSLCAIADCGYARAEFSVAIYSIKPGEYEYISNTITATVDPSHIDFAQFLRT
eukprot:GFYU01063358.1.p1 GENE.GFYU01063358.1~~GFYU01063358.1.p1  ORF type:complete len:142 (-),score=0.77 GFYU01063358.1:178-603(-)